MTFTITALYAPADRPDRFAKAYASGADEVILDLEDAVAPEHKDRARSLLEQAVATSGGTRTQVRVNAIGTPWHAEDLEAVATLPRDVGVRVPKCEKAAVVARIARRLPGRPLYALVESAVGVEQIPALARVPGVAGIGLGEADLRSDLGVTGEVALDPIRTTLVVAARAARLPAPLAAAYTDVADADGLLASTRHLADLGFVGRTVIHPRQIETVRQAFRPSSERVDRARRALAALEGATEAGAGVVVLADGTFLDPAMVRLHQRTVQLADQLGEG
ncbi:HpcH/HpaI aldolase/citrate lyase family protein [Mariniluteicoccus flavus]